MNLNRFFIVISLFFILILSITAISAIDNSNNENLSQTASDNLKSGNIIVVKPDSENPNQMVKPTVQPAIDDANSGDTLKLEGNFAHGHCLNYYSNY